MTLALETLLFPYVKKILPWPAAEQKLLFLNARWVEGISGVIVQPRFDFAKPFLDRQQQVLSVPPAGQRGLFDVVWALPGKDMLEMQHLIASACLAAKKNGTVVVAAANDAGGKRLAALLGELGLESAEESKNKGRVVWTVITSGFKQDKAQAWQEAGEEQKVLDTKIVSRPGLHSWDKIDAGSALLADHLPPNLSGAVADFGCGWGYLSLAVLKSEKVQAITLVDIDSRALALAEKNIEAQYPAARVNKIWADLSLAGVQHGPFDVIVLNPPFHAGTDAQPELGKAIITTAARSLKPAGMLYMVANRHLPYEETLKELFQETKKLAEQGGFKVFFGTKRL